jgi:KDO2-lipid IV(A) lauroyltransferase
VATDYSSFHPQRFLHPRFWPTWLGLGILRLLALLPYRPAVAVGRLLGRLTYYVVPKRRRIARTNLTLCLPMLSASERELIVRRSFENIGISIVEIAMTWWWPEESLAPLAEIEGLEHLEAALTEGRGAVLLTGHFTSLEIGGYLLSYRQPFQVMFRRQRNPLFDAYLNYKRTRHFVEAHPRANVRAMVRGIKQNHVTWYAPDQDFKRERTVFAPFFGVPASTLTATARIAQATGAAFLPFFPCRKEDGTGYYILIEAPLTGFPTGDEIADATTVNQSIEHNVRKQPDQYMWMHQRFKSRLPGEPGVY